MSPTLQREVVEVRISGLSGFAVATSGDLPVYSPRAEQARMSPRTALRRDGVTGRNDNWQYENLSLAEVDQRDVELWASLDELAEETDRSSPQISVDSPITTECASRRVDNG